MNNKYLIVTNKIYLYQKDKKCLISQIFILLLFFLPICLLKKNLRNLNSNDVITLIVKGAGEYKSFLSTLVTIPNKVTINGIVQDYPIINCLLTDPVNTIILSWDAPLTTCENMFYALDIILSIDFSEFDSSKVTSMNSLFSGCINLKTIKLKNLDTSSVKDMSNMFYGCISLTSLDLSNFNTSQVISMRNMFNNCTSLISVDLSSFNTSSVGNMDNMFYNDYSLISLDLSSFNISSLVLFNMPFANCKSLVFINLDSFVETSYVDANNVFSSDLNDLVYCIDENKASIIANNIKSININNDCNNTCFTKSIKIIIDKKKCIDKCTNDDTYVYEYNNICYDSEQNNTDNDTNENTIIDNIKDSENTEKTKSDNSESILSEDIESSNIYIIKSEIEEETENNKLSQYVEITEKTEENENSEKIKVNENTDKIKSDLNSEKMENDGNTDKNNENTEIVLKFNSENYFKETNIENTSKKDEIIKNIKEDLIKGNLDSLLQNVINGTKQDLIAADKDIIYQITTTENQKNNNYSNISTINLGECENKLKEIYHIDNNLSLIILKIDYFMPGLLIPVIGYEVYDPRNKTQLDLNYCKDITIKLNIPVSINESNIFKHDPNSEYYNDECNRYTTENGTDILINDRQNEYIENNLSLCENNCTFKGYDKDTKKALCECETKPKIGLISEIILDENILSNNFNTTDNTTSNIVIMKCVDTLFSKDGLITNIGSYLLLFTFVFNVISAIIFYKCGYHIIESDIEEVMNLKRKNKKKMSIYKISKSNKKIKRNSIISNPARRNSKKITFINKENGQHRVSSSKLKLKSLDIKLNFENTKKKKIKHLKKKISNNINIKIIEYKDCELNSLDYQTALKYDKRTFLQYYTSLLLSKHIILFSFYPINDYNVKIIKITLFFLSFDIYFAVNTLFFNCSEIHKIYEDGGEYSFSFFIPKIILSFIISYSIFSLMRYYSLSERFLMELKNEQNFDKANNMIPNTKRCLIIKYIIFYVLCFVFTTLFWFYLSSFCAIFQNSQIYVFKNTFISFGISIVFPIIYNLVPCLCRVLIEN